LAQNKASVHQTWKSAIFEKAKGELRTERPAAKPQAHTFALGGHVEKMEGLGAARAGSNTQNVSQRGLGNQASNQADQESCDSGPNFVIRKEKRPIMIKRPDTPSFSPDVSCTRDASASGMSSGTTKLSEPTARYEATRQPTSMQTAKPPGQKPVDGRHHRQLSSLNATAAPFQSTASSKPPNMAATTISCSALKSAGSSLRPNNAPYLPPGRFTLDGHHTPTVSPSRK
jgi:hypothetical protein